MPIVLSSISNRRTANDGASWRLAYFGIFAPPLAVQICLVCGAPLAAREDEFVLKYFLLRTANRKKGRGKSARPLSGHAGPIPIIRPSCPGCSNGRSINRKSPSRCRIWPGLSCLPECPARAPYSRDRTFESQRKLYVIKMEIDNMWSAYSHGGNGSGAGCQGV
jgi:hypothetical protein